MACVLVREEEAKKLKDTMVGGVVAKTAYYSQAIASPASKNMTAGYLKIEAGYADQLDAPLDEINLVLEGEMTYTSEGKTFTAKRGDIVFLEKGYNVHFTTEGGCFIFYVTYPLFKETLEELMKQLAK